MITEIDLPGLAIPTRVRKGSVEPNREIANLRRVLDVARYMAVTNDLDVLLGMIIEAACEVLDCERATIFLYDAATNELYSRVARGMDSIRFAADRGIAGAAATQRKLVNVRDAYADERFNRDVDRRTGFRTRNLLTFPLENLQGELIGVLQALNKRDEPFGADDEELARVLSAQAGVALERGKLIEEYALKQRMQRDLQIARQIQQGLFPDGQPSVPEYEVAGWNQSADETGGDCYDFFELPDGRLGIFLADAVGHGIGAALVMAQCRSLLRAMLSVTSDLAVVAAQVNTLLAEDLTDDRFVTAFVGILDPRTHRLDYFAAGQGPLLWLQGGQAELRAAGCVPLAVLPDMDPPQIEHFQFGRGDVLVLLTDGFYETQNAAGEQFGEDRVIAAARERALGSVSELISHIYDAAVRFAAGVPQGDDLTAVLIRRS